MSVRHADRRSRPDRPTPVRASPPVPAVVFLLVPALLAPGTESEPGAAKDLRERMEPCTLPLYEGEALCATHRVWEDRRARRGRRIGLRVALLPATGDSVLEDPVYVFDGGPGQGAAEAAAYLDQSLGDVRHRRDLVLVDRRGTGASNPLDCVEPRGEEELERYLRPFTPERAARCRRRLQKRADLTLYTTPLAVDDVDEVRAALGHERINLYGASFGSREALVYLRRHPEHVRSVIVEAVIPTHRKVALAAARIAQRSWDRLVDDCAASIPCREVYPELRVELDTVLARLARKPAAFRTTDATGREVELRLTRDAFAGTVRSLLVSQAGAARLPRIVHAAARGDFTEAGETTIRLRRLAPTRISRGLFLSVICAEEVARIGADEVGPATAGTFWGDAWIRSLQGQCREWPTADLPDVYFEPPGGTAPILLLSGWGDPISPPAWTRELPAHLPNARRLVVRHGQHNFHYRACGRELVARFLDRLDPWAPGAGCLSELERPDFALPAEGSGPGGEASGDAGPAPGAG